MQLKTSPKLGIITFEEFLSQVDEFSTYPGYDFKMEMIKEEDELFGTITYSQVNGQLQLKNKANLILIFCMILKRFKYEIPKINYMSLIDDIDFDALYVQNINSVNYMISYHAITVGKVLDYQIIIGEEDAFGNILNR